MHASNDLVNMLMPGPIVRILPPTGQYRAVPSGTPTPFLNPETSQKATSRPSEAYFSLGQSGPAHWRFHQGSVPHGSRGFPVSRSAKVGSQAAIPSQVGSSPLSTRPSTSHWFRCDLLDNEFKLDDPRLFVAFAQHVGQCSRKRWALAFAYAQSHDRIPHPPHVGGGTQLPMPGGNPAAPVSSAAIVGSMQGLDISASPDTLPVSSGPGRATAPPSSGVLELPPVSGPASTRIGLQLSLGSG